MTGEVNVSEEQKKPTIQELSNRLQGQLFELGRATYLFETQKRNLINAAASTAVALEETQKAAQAEVAKLAEPSGE